MKNLFLFAIAALLLHAQHSFCADQQPGNQFILQQGRFTYETYTNYKLPEDRNPKANGIGYRVVQSIGAQTIDEREAILKNIKSALDRNGIETDGVFYSIDICRLYTPRFYIPELDTYFYIINSADDSLYYRDGSPVSRVPYCDDYTNTDDIVRRVLKQIRDKRVSEAASFILQFFSYRPTTATIGALDKK